jgi:hypothetical protein
MTSFLEPESSFARSTTVESIKTFQNYQKKWKASIWASYRRPTPDENQEHFYYSHCPPEPCPNNYEKPYNTKNFTNITTHLRKHHDITAEKSLNKNQVIVNE